MHQMEELRGQSYVNYMYGKILSVLDKKWILLKKYNEELIRPKKYDALFRFLPNIWYYSGFYN